MVDNQVARFRGVCIEALLWCPGLICVTKLLACRTGVRSIQTCTQRLHVVLECGGDFAGWIELDSGVKRYRYLHVPVSGRISTTSAISNNASRCLMYYLEADLGEQLICSPGHSLVVSNLMGLTEIFSPSTSSPDMPMMGWDVSASGKSHECREEKWGRGD